MLLERANYQIAKIPIVSGVITFDSTFKYIYKEATFFAFKVFGGPHSVLHDKRPGASLHPLVHHCCRQFAIAKNFPNSAISKLEFEQHFEKDIFLLMVKKTHQADRQTWWKEYSHKLFTKAFIIIISKPSTHTNSYTYSCFPQLL